MDWIGNQSKALRNSSKNCVTSNHKRFISIGSIFFLSKLPPPGCAGDYVKNYHLKFVVPPSTYNRQTNLDGFSSCVLARLAAGLLVGTPLVPTALKSNPRHGNSTDYGMKTSKRSWKQSGQPSSEKRKTLTLSECANLVIEGGMETGQEVEGHDLPWNLLGQRQNVECLLARCLRAWIWEKVRTPLWLHCDDATSIASIGVKL